MNILTADHITKAYGERKLLKGTDFYLAEGEKVGILGINGTGKSTLLKLLAGLEQPDDGKVTKANGYLVKYLPQNPVFQMEETVLEAVLRQSIQGEEDRAVTPDAENQDKVHRLTIDAKEMLTRLGVTEFEENCGHLSGGQKKRLALVATLLSEADILVLDEPTNHLDLEMSEWLEGMLKKHRGAIIMVTHDRYFLDSVATRIVELDKGMLYSYAANYSGFLERKTMREEMALASERKRLSILRNELAWVRRGAQARSTKQKARLQRFEELQNTEAPVTDGRVELSSAYSRLGKTTIELQNISKVYGQQQLLQDFTYVFDKNDRVGFVGKNGSGKTTLMKMILGQVAPDSGEIVIGQTVKIGYYAQEIDDTMMKPRQRVIDYIRDVAEFVDTADGKISAAKLLERFLFEGEEQYGLLSKLSGGERRRLYLCKVLMQAPNVLILDEPTNDLDIATLQILEDYLDTFAGIVMVVSHDRYFLDRCVRRIFALGEEGKGGKPYRSEGGYSDYANRKAEENNGTVDVPKQSSTVKGDTQNWKQDRKKKLKFTFQEQKDYETIGGEIEKLEKKLEETLQEYNTCGSNFVRLNELAKQKETLEQTLEERMERWMYLEDLAERIEKGEMVE